MQIVVFEIGAGALDPRMNFLRVHVDICGIFPSKSLSDSLVLIVVMIAPNGFEVKIKLIWNCLKKLNRLEREISSME